MRNIKISEIITNRLLEESLKDTLMKIKYEFKILSLLVFMTFQPFIHVQAKDEDKTKVVTIMPLGDSITEGSNSFDSYRYSLMEKLLNAGYQVKYIGSKTTRPLKDSPLGTLAHEGYSGLNVGFFAKKINELYQKNPADILLIHAGHNQFADKLPIPGMLKDTRSIISTVRTINPKVIILLAQVIPSGKLPKYSYIPEFNSELEKLVQELHSTEQPLILVNQADGFNWETDTGADHVHPNSKGSEKMAQKWFEALQKILPPPSKD
jgi:acetyl esterase